MKRYEIGSAERHWGEWVAYKDVEKLEQDNTSLKEENKKLYLLTNKLLEDVVQLKELNREMVEALKRINELWNTRPQPSLRDEWDNAVETAGEVLAKAEGEEGNE